MGSKLQNSLEKPKAFKVVVINNWKEKTKCVRFEAYIFLAYTKRTMNRESETITRDAPMMDRVDVTTFGKEKGRRKKEQLISQWCNVFNRSARKHKPFGFSRRKETV